MPTVRLYADRTRTALVLGSLGGIRVFHDQDEIWTVSDHCVAELEARGVRVEPVSVQFEVDE